MSYAIRFLERAKAELGDCCAIYGGEFRGALYEWLNLLAQEAETKDLGPLSIDLQPLLEMAAENPDPGPWLHAWKRWGKASLLDKIRALGIVVKKRRPPWEIRFSSQTFPVLSGLFQSEVSVIYEVDHVEKRLVINRGSEALWPKDQIGLLGWAPAM